MTPPKTTVTQPPAQASHTTAPTRPSRPGVADDQSPAPRRVTHRVVWVGIALALTAAVAVLVSGLSDGGAEQVGLGGAIPADATTADPEVGTQLFVEDLRSIGRDPNVWRDAYVEDLRSIGRVDPVAGRVTYFEDLRSIGRDLNVWRDAYVEDLRSIGGADPVAGRVTYVEDLRSVGR